MTRGGIKCYVIRYMNASHPLFDLLQLAMHLWLYKTLLVCHFEHMSPMIFMHRFDDVRSCRYMFIYHRKCFSIKHSYMEYVSRFGIANHSGNNPFFLILLVFHVNCLFFIFPPCQIFTLFLNPPQKKNLWLMWLWCNAFLQNLYVIFL